MTTQRDPSPCCKQPLVTFASGGGGQVKGPYVKCSGCKKDYAINYKTGVLIQ